MVGQPASYTELITQDGGDEELRDVPKPPESTFVRPRSTASSWGRPRILRSGARSTSRSNSTISIMEACWGPNVDCTPQADSRCLGKAYRPEGACRHPGCKSCSEVRSKCSVQWLCAECLPMEEPNCTYLLMQTIQDQARLAEADTQRDFLASEAQLAERA
eukprot:1876252-Pyramimonas_sp.AAC.1